MSDLFSEQLSQALSLADKIDPTNAAAGGGTTNSTGIDFSKFGRVMYEIQIGTITGAGTLDARLQWSANSNMAGSSNITGGAITQVTNANPNCRVTVEVRADQVQQLHGVNARYVRLQVTTAANAVLYGATGWGAPAYQKPASQSGNDLNTTLIPQRLVV